VVGAGANVGVDVGGGVGVDVGRGVGVDVGRGVAVGVAVGVGVTVGGTTNAWTRCVVDGTKFGSKSEIPPKPMASARMTAAPQISRCGSSRGCADPPNASGGATGAL
jgi:hypothetical protein